jgi:hypothetical protein
MKNETKYIQELLPNHYTCSELENGVKCQSNIGIDDEDEYWGYFLKAIRQKFKARFLEMYNIVCTNNKNFIVYLRPVNA